MEPGTKAQTPRQDRWAKLIYLTNYDLFILILIVFALLIMVGILLPGNPAGQAILLRVDVLICVVFFVDFILMWRSASNKMSYLLREWGWLDLLGSIAAVPGLPWTALLRLARVNRPVQIFKRIRSEDRDDNRAKPRGNSAGTVLMSMTIIALVLLTITSLLVLRFERGAEGARIVSGAEAFWWAFVTMTTVGYGDYVPVTYAGRLLAIGLMTFGIGVFAILTSFVASKFAVQRSQREDLIALVREENAIIRADLAELKELIEQQNESN